MTADQLRDYKNKTPFTPFTIHMTDGTEFRITDPESLVLPKGWTADALLTKPRGRFSFIYLRNVTHISGSGPWPRVRKRRRGEGSGESEF
jgi:hypothetical protein